MKIEEVSLADLIADPQNARSHNEANLKAISGSLHQFGQRKPIVISKENIVVAGNGTVEAAKSLGWTKINAVRVPDDWSETKIKAFALADNRTADLAMWNEEVLAAQLVELQIENFDIEQIGFEIPEIPNDEDWESAFDSTVGEKKETLQMTFTLHADQSDVVNQALVMSKGLAEFGETGNSNANGNALARICEMWIGQQNVG